jgi:hypothetical protein
VDIDPPDPGGTEDDGGGHRLLRADRDQPDAALGKQQKQPCPVIVAGLAIVRSYGWLWPARGTPATAEENYSVLPYKEASAS